MVWEALLLALIPASPGFGYVRTPSVVHLGLPPAGRDPTTGHRSHLSVIIISKAFPLQVRFYLTTTSSITKS